MWKLIAALGTACLLSGCADWMDGLRDGRLACSVSHDAGTYTLLVRQDGVERALARTAPLSKEERQGLSGYTCGPEGQDVPCDHAAYVKDPKTGRWTPYAYGARETDGALLEEVFRDLPVVAGSRIIGSEANPCRLGPPGYFGGDRAADQPSAFLAATFSMQLSGRAFEVPGDRLAIALEEGATLDWFRPASVQRKAGAANAQEASTRIGLLEIGKLVAWALGVLGGTVVILDRLVPGLRRRRRMRRATSA